MRFLTIALLLALPTVPLPAQAESPTVGLWLDENGGARMKSVPAFVIDRMFLLASGVDDITGWEASIHWSDPTWNLLGVSIHPGDAFVEVFGDSYFVGLGRCVEGAPTYSKLATIQFGYFAGPIAPFDVRICVGGVSPSSFGGAPGYSNCSDELVPFAPAPDIELCGIAGWYAGIEGCALLNDSTDCGLDTQPTSLGALKARY